MVDSNVLIDLLLQDGSWFEWSRLSLQEAAEHSILAINPIIFAEVSATFLRVEDLDDALPPSAYLRLQLPYDAAFLAGRAFIKYRRRGGTRTSPLPDFYIGAHAAVARFRLLTRDASRYRTYFPTVELIAP